jgi:hypothetical protein
MHEQLNKTVMIKPFRARDNAHDKKTDADTNRP